MLIGVIFNAKHAKIFFKVCFIKTESSQSFVLIKLCELCVFNTSHTTIKKLSVKIPSVLPETKNLILAYD